MTQRTPRRAPALLAFSTALLVWEAGCAESNPPRLGSEIEPRAGLTQGLPLRVTLDSKVLPDAAYGESAHTVDEALNNLKATIKDGKLYDSKGGEIHFESAAARKTGASKRLPKGSSLIKLAD
jgi:hypothetical protein